MSDPQARDFLRNRLSAIPPESWRRLRELARKEQAQISVNRYWAKRLALFFGVATGLYLCVLAFGSLPAIVR